MGHKRETFLQTKVDIKTSFAAIAKEIIEQRFVNESGTAEDRTVLIGLSEDRYSPMVVNDQVLTIIEARTNPYSAKITRLRDGGSSMVALIDGYTLRADFLGELPKLDKNTKVFFLFLLIHFTAHRPNVSDKTIKFTCLEYIRYLGKEETKATIYETNKLILKCISKLQVFFLPFKEKPGDKPFYIPIGSGGALPGGLFGFKLSEDFYANLCCSGLMQMHTEAIRLLDGKDSGPLTLLVRLLSQKNMNIGKKNEDVHSVAKMLQWSDNIPDEDELLAKKLKSRNAFQETFQRLKGNLARLIDKGIIKGYCLCKDGHGKQPLTDKEANAIKTYAAAIELFIKIEWIDYPDEKKRRKAATDAIKKKQQRKTARTTATKTPGFKRTEVIDILAQDSTADQEEGG